MNSVTSGKSILYSLPSREDEKLSSVPLITINENVINPYFFLVILQVDGYLRGYIRCESRGRTWSGRGSLLDTGEDIQVTAHAARIHKN